MIQWAAIIVASLSWLFGFHQHIPENPVWQWLCIGTALVLSTIVQAGTPTVAQARRAYLLLLAPLVITFVLSEPSYDSSPVYHPALLVLALGVLLQGVMWEPLRFLRPLAGSTLLLGTILVAQSPVYYFCSGFAARAPEAPWISGALYALLKWVGADVSFSAGTMYLRLLRDVHAFNVTWDQLAIYPAVLIWLGGCLAMWWSRTERSYPARVSVLTLLLAAYVVIRLFVVILVFATMMLFVEYKSETVHVEVFWLPGVTALLFLPLIVFVQRFLPFGFRREDAGPSKEEIARVEARLETGVHKTSGGTPDATKAPGAEADHYGRRGGGVLVLAACVGCLGLTVSEHYYDPGVRKAGRVLMDESHSRWERSDTAYDTEWYGHESGYNFYCITQYLRHFFDVDVNLEEPLLAPKLERYDVLILKTPTQPYTPEEVAAIESFVRGGGGLLAIGEHTNVFGSSVCLNPVTRRFGMAFNYDCLFDIERKFEQVYFPPRVGAHPIVLGLPFFRFAVPCSIAVDSWDACPVIRSGGLWSLPIDYSSSNFYAQIKDATEARFGNFNQMVSTTAGLGRVAAFGDSTVYSNFEAFYPGKPELLLGAIEWLNRTNHREGVNRIGLYVFTVALLAAGLLWIRLRVNLPLAAVVVSTGAASAWLGMWACSLHAARSYPAPAPLRSVPVIVFDLEHGTGELPLFGFTKNYANSYEILYQWVLRPGYYPRVSFNLEHALYGDDPIVLIKPARAFAPSTVERVRAFLQRGGTLLVLDSPNNADSTANELLQPFGLKLQSGRCSGAVVVEPKSGSRICDVVAGQRVEGGESLLETEEGEPVLSYVKQGSGQLIAGGLAERLCDTNMGGSSRVVPDQRMRAVFELSFTLLRGLRERDIHRQIELLGKTYARD